MDRTQRAVGRVPRGRRRQSPATGVVAGVTKKRGLPTFAADSLSSSAYATQEILIVLAIGGATLYVATPWIAAVVVVVLAVVVVSYRQTVCAYPDGGGDYRVVSDNVGPRAGAVTGAALLLDYVLTVAVSASAAATNLASAIPVLREIRVPIAVGIVLFVVVINLRGTSATSLLFAVPVYLFVGSVFLMVLVAAVRLSLGMAVVAPSADREIIPEAQFTGLALVLLVARAFSSGATALTGIEAVSSATPQFREPRAANAAKSLVVLGVLAATMFAGVTWLAIVSEVRVTNTDDQINGLGLDQTQQTVINQIAQAVFPGLMVLTVLITLITAAILVSACNSPFGTFPVLASELARDGYLPLQLRGRGDRLAFSNGIMLLGFGAALLVIGFGADVSGLIALYLVGVFLALSLSQFGMARHWGRALREPHDESTARLQVRRALNVLGMVVSLLVLGIVMISKFTEGSWIVVLAVAVLTTFMTAVHRHYRNVATVLRPDPDEQFLLPSRVHAVVLVARIDQPAIRALRYAASSRPFSIEALHVDDNSRDSLDLVAGWQVRGIEIPLVRLASPYREVVRPVIDYVAGMHRSGPRDLIVVYLPAFEYEHWWEALLHKGTAVRLRSRLLSMPGVVVAAVPWRIEGEQAATGQARSQPDAADEFTDNPLATDQERWPG